MTIETSLCQLEGTSCGACCGLYNYAVSTEDALERRLRKRTALMRDHDKSPAGLLALASEISGSEDRGKVHPEIYCCPFLGFIEGGETKVGCLLHPAQNQGIDLRGVSFYGIDLCRDHLCPAHHFLDRREKGFLADISLDWYLYGLTVVDLEFVKGYFSLISRGIGGDLPADIFRKPPFRDLAQRFFSLKLTWPFRAAKINELGHFYFDGGQSQVRLIDYERLGGKTSRFHGIFISLLSSFSSGEGLLAAEGIIAGEIGKFLEAYRAMGGQGRLYDI